MWKGQIPSHHRLGYTKRKITLCYSTNTAFFSLLRLLLIIVMQGSLIRAAAHQATEGKGWLVEVSACYHCQFRILFFFFHLRSDGLSSQLPGDVFQDQRTIENKEEASAFSPPLSPTTKE